MGAKRLPAIAMHEYRLCLGKARHVKEKGDLRSPCSSHTASEYIAMSLSSEAARSLSKAFFSVCLILSLVRE